jgi:predicted DNA binding protein
MPRVRLKHKPAGSLSDFSADHPEATIKILSAYLGDDGVVAYVQAEMADPAALIQYTDEEPATLSYEVLHEDEYVILLEVVMAEPSATFHAAINSKTVSMWPVIVRDGWMFIEVVTSSKRLSQFKDELAAADITFEIISATPSPDPATLLTDRQREFIIEAVARGYYATPRQCSLTDLADTMGVTKGSASRVVSWYHILRGRVTRVFLSVVSAVSMVDTGIDVNYVSASANSASNVQWLTVTSMSAPLLPRT